MIISPNDQKEYRYTQLSNGLAVLLIHDEHCKKSAASMAVNVGHFDDPDTHQGLAHLLEHMLFLGTEKYPKAGEYQEFISMHGGSNNAWTGTDFTNYYFDISNRYFNNALDRFAQFFISPTFDATLLDRERNAVDSEYKLKLNDDTRRFYQVHKETVNQAHPFAKFSVGNLTTLQDSEQEKLQDKLISFYEQHYCASIMKLVVQSDQPLDQQEKLVTQLFSDVVNRGGKAYQPAVPMYEQAQLQKTIWVESLKGNKRLTITFPLDSINPFYQIKPLSYISQLLGHEGEGSLLSALKKQGWATSLSAGGGISGPDFKDYNITLMLSNEGFSHINEIVGYCLSYIHLIAEQGLQAWRYEEKQTLLEQAFRFQAKIPAVKNVSHLAQNLFLYSPEHVVYGDYIMSGFDENVIRHFLQQLKVSNMRLMVLAPNIPTDKTAAWYHTPYRVEAFSQAQIDLWNETQHISGLSLPPKNPFISSKLTAQAIEEDNQTKHPVLIENKTGFRTWYQQESHFHVPKGNIFISLDSGFAVANPRNIAMTRLAVELLLEQLSSLTYQAEIAGISYHLYSHQGGFTLHISGFAQNQLTLLKLIIGHRHLQSVDPATFDSIRNQLLIAWNNQQQAKPINQLFNELTSVLQPSNPSSIRLAKELVGIKHEHLPDYLEQVYKNINIEVLIHGNWLRKEAEEISSYIQAQLIPISSPGKETPRRLVNIQDAGTLIREVNCNHNDSALIVYYQAAKVSAQELAYYTLANHIMSSKFFYELRTQQQLGYVVGTGNLPLNRHAGIIFYVQSPHAEPGKLQDAINDFIDFFPFGMISFTEQQWQSSKQGLISQLREKDSNLNGKSKRYWNAIGIKDHNFDKHLRIAAAVEEIERVDLIRFMVELKSRTSDRLIMVSTGLEHGSDEEHIAGTLIEDVDQFQQTRPFFAL